MEPKHIDYTLLVVTLLLMAVGVMMVYSSSAILAQERYHDGLYFLKREVAFTAVGILLIFLGKNINYRLYFKLTYPLLLATFVLLSLVFIPGIGHSAGGAQRWIRVAGFTLQPSEVTKLTVIIFLAYALSKKGEKIRGFKKGFLPVMLIAGVFSGIVLLQKDLGTAFVITTVIGIMLFIGGTRFYYLLGLIIASVPVLYFLIFSVDYRRKRILAFLDPWQHPLDSGFQIIQSYVAFNSGGLLGTGLGQGKQKLFYLPAAHTDFIFSVIGEELGLIGVFFVFGLFLVFMLRGIKIAFRAPDAFGSFLAFGITALVTVQAIFNFGVVMGLLPTKGLPLPFISHGGTALLMVSLMVGILLNISSQANKQ
jgi:cell division protein FtsW